MSALQTHTQAAEWGLQSLAQYLDDAQFLTTAESPMRDLHVYEVRPEKRTV